MTIFHRKNMGEGSQTTLCITSRLEIMGYSLKPCKANKFIIHMAKDRHRAWSSDLTPEGCVARLNLD